MLFGFVRIVFWGIAFLFSSILIKKSRICRKRTWIIRTFIIAIALATASAFFPVEDAIVNFSSAEKSYQYNHSGTVMLEVNGEKSSYKEEKKGDAYEYAIIPKATHGWKLGLGVDMEQVIQTTSDGISIQVYRHKKTGEHFVAAQVMQGGPADISDVQNSTFLRLEEGTSALGKTFYTYYAYISKFDDEYALTANGVLVNPML